MKKCFLGIVSLFVVGLTGNLFAGTKTIVDYYNEIPKSYFGSNKYELKYVNQKWISKSYMDYEFDPIVDIKNGYIKIEDPGTGGGATVYELALYLASDNKVIMGINTKNYNGMNEDSQLVFLLKNGNQWLDVTYEIFPTITISITGDFYLLTII